MEKNYVFSKKIHKNNKYAKYKTNERIKKRRGTIKVGKGTKKPMFCADSIRIRLLFTVYHTHTQRLTSNLLFSNESIINVYECNIRIDMQQYVLHMGMCVCIRVPLSIFFFFLQLPTTNMKATVGKTFICYDSKADANLVGPVSF